MHLTSHNPHHASFLFIWLDDKTNTNFCVYDPLVIFLRLYSKYVSINCSHFHWLYHLFWWASCLQPCHLGKVRWVSFVWYGNMIVLVEKLSKSYRWMMIVYVLFIHLYAVRYDLRHLLFSIMWASFSVALAAFMRANGRIFCNRPRLHRPRH